MSERSLRWASHAAALLWGLALLALTSQPAANPAAPLPVVARVRPVTEPAAEPETARPQEPPARPEPAPRPDSAPRPDPPAVPPKASQPRSVGADELAAGESLLDGAGRFPALSFGYGDFASFSAYAGAMVDLGARFVVVRGREIVGSVDVASGAVGEPRVGPGFSPRARDYTAEPGLARAARAVRERFGATAVVMMLVPRSLDAGLFGGIARALEESGESTAGVREVRGRYERSPDGGVWLRVELAVRRDGSSLELDATFDLARIARRA